MNYDEAIDFCEERGTRSRSSSSSTSSTDGTDGTGSTTSTSEDVSDDGNCGSQFLKPGTPVSSRIRQPPQLVLPQSSRQSSMKNPGEESRKLSSADFIPTYKGETGYYPRNLYDRSAGPFDFHEQVDPDSDIFAGTPHPNLPMDSEILPKVRNKLMS